MDKIADSLVARKI